MPKLSIFLNHDDNLLLEKYMEENNIKKISHGIAAMIREASPYVINYHMELKEVNK